MKREREREGGGRESLDTERDRYNERKRPSSKLRVMTKIKHIMC